MILSDKSTRHAIHIDAYEGVASRNKFHSPQALIDLWFINASSAAKPKREHIDYVGKMMIEKCLEVFRFSPTLNRFQSLIHTIRNQKKMSLRADKEVSSTLLMN